MCETFFFVFLRSDEVNTNWMLITILKVVFTVMLQGNVNVVGELTENDVKVCLSGPIIHPC